MNYDEYKTQTPEKSGYEMRIKATFVGRNLSLGYETNKEYELKVCDNQAVCIVRLDGTGRCYYSTLHKFLENWENIKKIV